MDPVVRGAFNAGMVADAAGPALSEMPAALAEAGCSLAERDAELARAASSAAASFAVEEPSTAAAETTASSEAMVPHRQNPAYYYQTEDLRNWAADSMVHLVCCKLWKVLHLRMLVGFSR